MMHQVKLKCMDELSCKKLQVIGLIFFGIGVKLKTYMLFIDL